MDGRGPAGSGGELGRWGPRGAPALAGRGWGGRGQPGGPGPVAAPPSGAPHEPPVMGGRPQASGQAPRLRAAPGRRSSCVPCPGSWTWSLYNRKTRVSAPPATFLRSPARPRPPPPPPNPRSRAGGSGPARPGPAAPAPAGSHPGRSGGAGGPGQAKAFQCLPRAPRPRPPPAGGYVGDAPKGKQGRNAGGRPSVLSLRLGCGTWRQAESAEGGGGSGEDWGQGPGRPGALRAAGTGDSRTGGR